MAAQGVTKLKAQEQERERKEKKCSNSDLKFLQDPLEDLRIWKLKSGERCGGESALSKCVSDRVKIETVDCMARSVDSFSPKVVRRLVLIKHGPSCLNECPLHGQVHGFILGFGIKSFTLGEVEQLLSERLVMVTTGGTSLAFHDLFLKRLSANHEDLALIPIESSLERGE
ncbi:hypothetical protein U9M48_043264 [Paspalum notatum var. saurae]|uniref:Uncharacterized protein n=1 Tax=Paspalum notatum var. saurae TaxID=547442 RepID=A0AAQ3XGY5_PASNO